MEMLWYVGIGCLVVLNNVVVDVTASVVVIALIISAVTPRIVSQSIIHTLPLP